MAAAALFLGHDYQGPMNIVLHRDGGEEQVGRFKGAILNKLSYYLFPIAGCALISSTPAWKCDWSIAPQLRREFVGFQPSAIGTSPETPTLLMEALRRLRDRPPPPAPSP